MSAAIDAIASALTSAGLAGGSTGWVVHKLVAQDLPDQALVIYETGGTPSEHATDRRWLQPSFQVVVRGLTAKPAADKAAAVLAALDGGVVAGFEFFRATQSAPAAIGVDERSRPMFSVNFRGGAS